MKCWLCFPGAKRIGKERGVVQASPANLENRVRYYNRLNTNRKVNLKESTRSRLPFWTVAFPILTSVTTALNIHTLISSWRSLSKGQLCPRQINGKHTSGWTL